MKKFSNISGVKVPKEKKVEEIAINEEELFKAKIMNLMEQLLTVRTYGPVDRYLRAGSIKISGKEMFLEALMDLLKDKTLKQETKILESLKSSIKDWKVIDGKILEAQRKIQNIELKRDLSNNINKISSLLKTYGHDRELLMKMVDESCSKIKKAETAKLNSIATIILTEESSYDKSLLIEISEKFEVKAKQLGY